jgi:hypothetical protein
MAEVFAPFIINRTIRDLTFYCMEGRNFVRKKSSLTRRKVLYSPQFKNTRHFAGLMAKASKIGSLVFNALPAYWRQGWMYRSFTGEAFRMLKAGKKAPEIQQVLWERYVKEVVSRQPKEVIIAQFNSQPKRAYRKLNSTYWTSKTIKSTRRKANRQRLMHNAGLMAQASKIGANLYAQFPRKYARRSYYQYLTGLAFKLLKLEISEEDILTALRPTLPSVHREHKATRRKPANVINHPRGQYHFILSLPKRFPAPDNGAIQIVCRCSPTAKKNPLQDYRGDNQN